MRCEEETRSQNAGFVALYTALQQGGLPLNVENVLISVPDRLV